MSNIAIHTENLGKRYRLGATVDFSRTFREALLGLPNYFYHLTKSKAKLLLDKTQYPKDTPKDTFWALRDINLDIRHGDVVGIIGRNGAGKSTLLKILSKITSPTTGIARINGRVGSLLEVGTGFHPELTGRENIYLNGSILGMRKAEIEKKFDEIVAFAEVEQFLDTPIKRYSSGMQVRLAFAVAAHLEPEILIVDEVLAVGDAAFQKKCLGKMEDVSKEGRTVLFVSHNMGAVRNLCSKSILLSSGMVEMIGGTSEVINSYLENIKDFEANFNDRTGNGKVRFEEIQTLNLNGNYTNSYFLGEDIIIILKLKFTDKVFSPQIGILFTDVFDTPLAQIINQDDNFNIETEKNILNLMVKVSDVNFSPNDYFINFWMGFGSEVYDSIKRGIKITINQNDYIKRKTNYPSHVKMVLKSKWSSVNEIL